ncbi:MAG TPA: transketolase [Verrucomicrobiae bacterium]|nr:transketolase [Verrucomicrobiae bacterium]
MDPQPEPTVARLPQAGSPLDDRAINTLRCLAIDAVEQANSGHPGLPMGAAPMAYVLWTRILRHSPRNPGWPDRDRFVLSAGHGSMLLYSLLNLTGYDLPLAELRRFRQWGSRTPGHPERGVTAGVEVTTGPLGQGFGNAVGMAIAERVLAHRFNRPDHPIVDHRTFVLCGDGDLMEGVSAEAASLAGHLGLGRLICLYDDNHVSLDGPTSLAFTESVPMRFRAYGWQVLTVAEGETDLDAIDRALRDALDETERPTLIAVRTHIGYGAPTKQDTSKAHGSPLGPAEVRAAKLAYGFDPAQTFVVPPDVAELLGRAVARGAELEASWQRRFDNWAQAFPDLADEWGRGEADSPDPGWGDRLPSFAPEDGPLATRTAGERVLQAVVHEVPWVIGGDADLSESTKTAIAGGGDFDARTGAGRNLHFGVREHAMGAACNGMAAHGGLRPYSATFFTFSDYQRPAIRLAALSHLPVIFVYTHDSIGLGEDGPTHQPVEQLAALRAMPNLDVFRPGDANETAAAWRCAVERRDGPTAIVCSRQALPVYREARGDQGARVDLGAYILQEASGGAPRCVLLATGSELSLAVRAREILEQRGIPTRMVSVPCLDRLERMGGVDRDRLLPPEVRCRVAVEAGVSDPWYRWVGSGGEVVGVDRYGASAPYQEIYQHFGLTADAVVARAEALLRP